jgi:hypothetical protein
VRLPYIQVTQETWAHAKGVAGVLEISENSAFKLICDLWRWALEEIDERKPVETWGDHRTPHASKLFAGATDWKGDAELLTEALEAVGLVRRLDPVGLRVTGLERYATALETRAKRSEAGRAGAAKRWQNDGKAIANACDGDSKGLAKHGQTQTQTQKKESFAGKKPPAPDRPEKQPDPRHAPLVKALMAETPGYAFTGRDAKAVSELLTLGTDQEIRDRWRRARASNGFPKVRTLPELATHWNHFTQEQPTRRTGEEDPCRLIGG